MLTPYDELLLHKLRDIQRRTGRAVPSMTLSIATGVPLRSIQRYLKSLEQLGKVEHPPGRPAPHIARPGLRSGWLIKQ